MPIYDKLTDLRSLSPFGKILAVACLGVAFLIVATGVGLGVNHFSEARASKREAARMKQIQAALAVAETKTKEAEAKEAQADLLKHLNEGRARVAGDKTAAIETEAKKTDEAIKQDYERDKARIESSLSDCDRCRDVCTRLDRVAVANPALAEYRCNRESCAESCPDANP